MLNLKTLKHSLLCTLLFFTLAALLVGCGDSQPKKDANKIRVGIMLGAEQKPHLQETSLLFPVQHLHAL